VRCDLIDAIKDQIPLLDDKPEGVSPIPSVVLDDTMSVNLHPEVEADEDPTNDPAQDVCEDRLIGRKVEVGDRKQRIRQEVTGVSMKRSETYLRRTMSTSCLNMSQALNSWGTSSQE
jgi:hypothetical protein